MTQIGPVIGVIQQFLHPPVGILQREIIEPQHIVGRASFQRVRGPIGVEAMGIGFESEEIPAGYGGVFKAGNVEYDRRIATIRVLHLLRDGSQEWTQEIVTNSARGYILFIESFPWLVDTELAPGVVGTWYWLLALGI